MALSSAVAFFIFASTSITTDQLGQLLGSDPAAGLAGDVAGAHRGQHPLGLAGADVLLRLPWKQFGPQGLQPVHGLNRPRVNASRRSTSIRSASS